MSDFESDSKDEAYFDRNQAAMAFAKLADESGFIVGVKKTDDLDWMLLFVDLPQGQISWHLPTKELVGIWFEYFDDWDGHDLSEKRLRLSDFICGLGE